MCCNDAIAYAKMCLPPINSATSLCKKNKKKHNIDTITKHSTKTGMQIILVR